MNNISRKCNRIAASIIFAAVLFGCLAPIAGSADYEAGVIASFELKDEGAGENVLGTIIDKSAARDIASYENPFVCTRLSIVNARIYIDDGSSVEWGSFYWRASSLDSGVAEAAGEHITSGDRSPPFGDGVYDEGYLLRADILSAGITVVSVEVSASPDMSGSIVKTFTIRVGNDADEELEEVEEITDEIEEETEEITEEEAESDIKFADDFNDGRIISAELTRGGLNQKIYTGVENAIYLPAGVGDYGAMTLIIDKVSDHIGALYEYRWDITQNYLYYLDNMLSIDRSSGVTEDGTAVIKFGTELISAETDKITLTIRLTPKIGGGYDSSKALNISFGVIINGLGGKFGLEIDYAEEKLLIVNTQIGENKSYYSFGGAPEYMYCLKPSEQSPEQWFPFMGSSMDISRLIPKSGTAPLVIAVCEVGAAREDDGNISPENRKTVELYPRRIVTASEKKAVIYKDEKIIYGALTSGVEYILYKVGAGEFERGELNAYTGIKVSKESNPLGNTVAVKFAATVDRENEENNRFASAEFKIKVPKAGKIPPVKDDGKKKYSGFTNAMAWSATGEDGSWEQCERGAVKYENLKRAFPGLRPDDDHKFYNLYIKTAKTSKNPESGVLIIKIHADKYENY